MRYTGLVLVGARALVIAQLSGLAMSQDASLQLRDGFLVGNVVTWDGRPVARAHIALEHKLGHAVYSAIADGSGEFAVPHMAFGQYRVIARSPEWKGAVAWVSVEPGAIGYVCVVASELLAASGTVVDDSGARVDGALIMALPSDEMLRAVAGVETTRAATSGTFAVSVPRAVYDVLVVAPGFRARLVKRLTPSALPNAIALTRASTTAPWRLAFSGDDARSSLKVSVFLRNGLSTEWPWIEANGPDGWKVLGLPLEDVVTVTPFAKGCNMTPRDFASAELEAPEPACVKVSRLAPEAESTVSVVVEDLSRHPIAGLQLVALLSNGSTQSRISDAAGRAEFPMGSGSQVAIYAIGDDWVPSGGGVGAAEVSGRWMVSGGDGHNHRIVAEPAELTVGRVVREGHCYGWHVVADVESGGRLIHPAWPISTGHVVRMLTPKDLLRKAQNVRVTDHEGRTRYSIDAAALPRRLQEASAATGTRCLGDLPIPVGGTIHVRIITKAGAQPGVCVVRIDGGGIETWRTTGASGELVMPDLPGMAYSVSVFRGSGVACGEEKINVTCGKTAECAVCID